MLCAAITSIYGNFIFSILLNVWLDVGTFIASACLLGIYFSFVFPLLQVYDFLV